MIYNNKTDANGWKQLNSGVLDVHCVYIYPLILPTYKQKLKEICKNIIKCGIFFSCEWEINVIDK